MTRPPVADGRSETLVTIVVVVMLVAEVAVVFPIPLVVMRDAAVLSFPVAVEETFAVVMRGYPNGPFVGRASPIPVVPPVSISCRVPVTVHPNKAGAGRGGPDANHSWRRRRPYANSDRYLAKDRECRQEQD